MTIVDRIGAAMLATLVLAACALALRLLGDVSPAAIPLFFAGLICGAAVVLGLCRRVVTGDDASRVVPWPIDFTFYLVLGVTAAGAAAVVGADSIQLALLFVGVAVVAGFLAKLAFRARAAEVRPRALVYDKAEWHLPADGVGREGQNEYVFGGLYLAWLAGQQIVDDGAFDADESLLESIRARRVGVCALYEGAAGVLDSDLLTAEGNRFTADYFESGYAKDYAEIFAVPEDAFARVADSWENFGKLKVRLDERYMVWKAGGAGSTGAVRE